jgi:hypothetical protein
MYLNLHTHKTTTSGSYGSDTAGGDDHTHATVPRSSCVSLSHGCMFVVAFTYYLRNPLNERVRTFVSEKERHYVQGRPVVQTRA